VLAMPTEKTTSAMKKEGLSVQHVLIAMEELGFHFSTKLLPALLLA
jgi:hypothetical protein